MPEAVSPAEELFARVPAQLSVCAEYDGDTEYRISEQLHMQTRSAKKKQKKPLFIVSLQTKNGDSSLGSACRIAQTPGLPSKDAPRRNTVETLVEPS